MVLVLVSWSWGRWRGGTTTGVGPRLAGLGVALASFDVVGRLLGCRAFLGPGFADGVRLGQVGQLLVAQGDCIGDAPPSGLSVCSACAVRAHNVSTAVCRWLSSASRRLALIARLLEASAWR